MTRGHVDRVTPSFLDAPEVRTERIATVAILRPIDKAYSYRVPSAMAERLQPGMRVSAPFGRSGKPTPGICLAVSEGPWDSTLRELIEVIDERPMLSAAMLRLGEWVAKYYAAPLGRTLDLMVPAGSKRGAGRKKVMYAVLLEECTREPALEGTKGKAAAKWEAVIGALRAAGGRSVAKSLCEHVGCTAATLKTMEKRGMVRLEQVMEAVSREEAAPRMDVPRFELNAAQKEAISRIGQAVAARKFSVQVLFGVTGSGKTEVYVAAMRQALAEGRQAILLVPEIALTTQTMRRLTARFEKVVTLHSGLTDAERSRAWARIASGEVPVVIGTRSAVFAPCPAPGVIIVDEEQEPSYKSQAAPRYHTRDVAVVRGEMEGIAVVLGSATPSLETWKNVKTKKHYQLIRLPERVAGMSVPTVHLVDMRDEQRERLAESGGGPHRVHLLSRELETRLGQTLSRGEQAVLLLNRRGYAGYLHCPKCRTVVTCPHCSVRMVFHRTTGQAHCHYCHTVSPVPTACPNTSCDGRLVRFGLGTQRVEEELAAKYPSARVRRMDSDVMKKASDYADVLGAFERREFDILVGTQMIAKGLDFPFVSLVGVVSADTAMSISDFRSEERTFQLVLQVAGRCGRGDVGGHAVVQTFAADNLAVRHAVEGQYEQFADEELRRRQRTGLPPATRLVRIVVADERASKAEKAAEVMAAAMDALITQRGIKASLFGPHAAPIARLRDKYRFDVQITFEKTSMVQGAMEAFKREGVLRAGAASVVVDVDPVSLQ